MIEIPTRFTDFLTTTPAPAYRVMLLTKNGVVLESVPVSVKDDGDGRDRARSMGDGRAVELWDGLRFIEHFPPVD